MSLLASWQDLVRTWAPAEVQVAGTVLFLTYSFIWRDTATVLTLFCVAKSYSCDLEYLSCREVTEFGACRNESAGGPLQQ
jgi:hypothetical protein